jgi:hypothetical protein
MNETHHQVKNQFLNSLKRGTGEAYWLLKQNPEIDFSDLIVRGATTNFAYDPQSEGSRAHYIHRLIQQAKQKDKIIRTILKKLANQPGDAYGLDQLCDLAVLFYKSGWLEAKTALFNRLEKSVLGGYEVCGQAQTIELAGLEGILKVAETVGQVIIENTEYEEYSWPIDQYQKKHKAVDVYAELAQASQTNPYVAAYLTAITNNRRDKPTRVKKHKRWSYEVVKARIEQGKLWVIARERANELTEEEVNKLAYDFLAENAPSQQLGYLQFFGGRKFPLGHQPLLKLAQQQNPRKAGLAKLALEALQFFRDDELRQFALEKLRTAKQCADYLPLLVANFQTGDGELLAEIASRSDGYDYIHDLVASYISIFEANKTPECHGPLEIIYQKMNCGLHRESIAQILFANGVLSDKIYRELEFDSYIGVREFYRKLKKSRKAMGKGA